MKSAFAIVLATIFVVFVSAHPPPKCPEENGEDVVLLPNPHNCSTYYSCNGGIPFLMQCNEGLLYNEDLRVCDYPENVKCAASPSSPHPQPPNTSGPQTTGTRPPSSSPRPSVVPSGCSSDVSTAGAE
ncbi:PREDICTED: peritrophin-1-like [Eufriesea mexicana]|uniref:peritrophin-1-like n=1 Tax=Eufriesea mexicana TaxID=516756 RepID=UPI00083BF85C|nr:PREDICTED: peritrophin-1-like [Eufriesea mexicana]